MEINHKELNGIHVLESHLFGKSQRVNQTNPVDIKQTELETPVQQNPKGSFKPIAVICDCRVVKAYSHLMDWM